MALNHRITALEKSFNVYSIDYDKLLRQGRKRTGQLKPDYPTVDDLLMQLEAADALERKLLQGRLRVLGVVTSVENNTVSILQCI